MFNIEELLINGKIKYKTWKNLKKEEREEILDLVAEEDYPKDILDEIAPENRDGDLPEKSSKFQIEWREKNNEPRIPSRESIDNAQQAILTEYLKTQKENNEKIQELVSTFKELQKQSDPSKTQEMLIKTITQYGATLKDIGSSEDKYKDIYDTFLEKFVDKPYYIADNDKYSLFKQYEHRTGMVKNLLIQTKNNSLEEYFETLKDILEDSRDPAIYEIRENIFNITIYVLNPENGRLDPYTFNSSMGCKEILYQIHRILLKDEDVEGSDKYIYIRKNLDSITISSMDIKQLAGADKYTHGENSYFKVFKYKNYAAKVKNVCFYKSLEYICESENIKIFKKGRYASMRNIILGKDLLYNDDFTFDLKDLEKLGNVEGLRNLNIFVLSDEVPLIMPDDDSIKFTKYENIVRKYFLRIPILYSTRIGTMVKDFDYLDYRPGYTRMCVKENCAYVELKKYPNERFYLMLYKNNHITNLESIIVPKHCSKCLSIEHTEKDVERDPFVKVECLKKILKQIPAEEYKKQMPETLYISHDYETHVRDYIQYTHSVAFVVSNADKKIIERKYMEGRHVQHNFVKYLKDKYPGNIKFLIGFNSSSFDNYFTLDALMNIYREDLNSGHGNVINKNKILSIRMHGFILWDLYNFCKSSLSNSCKAYGIVGKKNSLIQENVLKLIEKYNWDRSMLKSDWSQIPHLAVTELFKQYNFNKKIFYSDDWKSLDNEIYNLNDAEITMELFWKVKMEMEKETRKELKQGFIDDKDKSVIKIDEEGKKYRENKKTKERDYENIYRKGLDITNFVTLSSMIYAYFNLKFDKLDYEKYNNVFDEVLGGRTQAFEKIHIENDRFGLIDINSSYPYVGITYDMPDGNITECEKLLDENENDIYLCLCTVVQSNLKIKYCGVKSEDEPNDWNQNLVENIWLWKEEIEELEKHKVKIIPKKYLVWSRKTNQIGPVQKELRDKRIFYKVEQKECIKKIEKLFFDLLRKQDFDFYDSFIFVKENLPQDEKYNQINLFVKYYLEKTIQDFDEISMDKNLEKYFYQVVIYKKILEKGSVEFEDLGLENIYEEHYKIFKENIDFEELSKTVDEKIGYKVKEMITKLKSNGISGKCIEKNHDDVWRITSHKNKLVDWGKRYGNTTEFEIVGRDRFLLKGLNNHSETINKPRHWGARILSLGRLNLWKEMIKYSRVLYCDTDSCIVPYDEINHEELDSKEYGKWDLEYDTNELFIISPKNYWLGDKKCSLKSYSDKDIWEVRKKHYIKDDVRFYYENSDKTTVMYDIDEMGEKKYYYYRKDKVILSGKGRTKELYYYLLKNDEYVVTTTFQRFTKKFVEKADEGGFELFTIHTQETVKILS